MKKKLFFIITSISILLIVALGGNTLFSFANVASVTFGSDEYFVESGQTFPIGIYLKGDVPIKQYSVSVRYDSKRLKYISGADRVDEKLGMMYFEGSGDSTNFRFWVTMEATSGGESGINAENAEVWDFDGEAYSPFEVRELGNAPIHLSGEDTVTMATVTEQGETAGSGALLTEEKEETEETEEIVDEKVPVQDIAPEINDSTTEETSQEQVLTAEAIDNSVENAEKEGVAGSFGELSFLGLKGWAMYGILAAFLAGIILAIVGFVMLIADIRQERQYKKQMIENRRLLEKSAVNTDSDKGTGLSGIELVDLADSDKNEGTPVVSTASAVPPVIVVDHVTMKFNIATSNTSGIKEYLIQRVKKQLSTRPLLALNDVSFNVLKGEVVGIIGTNGSGKSTILKIISGALSPSSGKVIVDRRKIQILTLGTGFDYELTARENVYLNGSIIGYSRKFIDEHYDEIVKFAELEDFMEEKVKNFSSGMVSRLGFAIATVADAAEILILDEVLSVGDEFFRKKSLARIKELIHGGSTVLMVSHSLSTIMDNCTKCVWIEKGVLRMVGKPKEVCEAYTNLNNSSANGG